MERTEEFFNTWLKSQEKFLEDWMEAVKKIPQNFWGLNFLGTGQMDTGGDGPFALYRSWFGEMINAALKMRGLNTDVIKDTLSKMSSSSNVYVKFYEIWLPIARAVQERITDVNLYRELVDPAKYKEVIDNIFGFSPDSIRDYIEQVSKLSETLGISAGKFGTPWAAAFKKNFKMMPDLVEGRPETFLHIFHNLFQAFDETVGKIYHIPPVGKDREKIELMMRGFDDLAVFLAKNIEYQNSVYVIALRAMEKVLETIATKIKDGEEIKTFNDFFDLWVDVNEREYHDLFRTGEFSRIQNELMDAAVKVRGHFYKLMELYLFDFPVALRSEMDDLYKTVYDLKKKVRTLERQLNEAKVKEAAA